jgi:hypothetical protein
MFAYVRIRIAVKRWSLSIATEASLTWSRPWLSERNVSERSASHLTGRPTLRAAQGTAAYSGYGQTRVPKPPPRSPQITRNLSLGTFSTLSASCASMRCVFCVGHQSVNDCVAASNCATTAFGSIGLDTMRLLTIRTETTLCAALKAASTAA